MPDDPIKQEKHVTELAGPDDRWVSVTDASRIARRQEHTIRSWIAQGMLPVHPERVGINKKTRQVRVSDLVKLTPIIDPDAGIATDLGTLDLPSIPKQQQQLMEQMTALKLDMVGQLMGLVKQFREVADVQEKFAEETRQTWRTHQQQYQVLASRDEKLQQHIQQVQETLAENLRGVDQAIRQELGSVLSLHALLDERVKAQDQAWELAQQELRDQLAQTERTLHQEMASLVAHIEQTRRESAEAVENEARQLRRALDAQGSLQQMLQKQIDEERKAREALGHQVAAMLKKREEGRK